MRPSLVTATRNHVGPAATGLLCGLSAGLAVATVIVARTPAELRVIEHVATPVLVPMPMPVPMMIPAAAVDPRAHEIALVFTVNKVTYVKLANLGESGELMPKHGKPKLVNRDGGASVVETVREADMPPALRAWQGRHVVVDGTCEATVTGFAVVAQLSGDAGYASRDTWDADSVLESGTPVLAARLDKCTGTYARDAALSPIIVPVAVEDDELVQAARTQLIASAAAQAVQAKWLEQGRAGHWYDDADLKTQVVRHPKTGVTFVSIHGNISEGCGGPEGNVWGLFRASSDRTLVPIELRDAGELQTIDKLVDIAGDGELEIIGHPFFGSDTQIARHDGTLIEHFEVPFFGCPC